MKTRMALPTAQKVVQLKLSESVLHQADSLVAENSMADKEKQVSALVKAASDLLPVKELYQDAVKPMAEELGHTGQTIGSLLNSALRPLRSLDKAWNALFDRLDGWLQSRLSDVDPSRIIEPKANVTGNLLTGLLFAQDEPDLREMFINLLARSMITEYRNSVHPSFAGILRDMTPDEARIIKLLSSCRKLSAVRVRGRTPLAKAWNTPHKSAKCSTRREAFSNFAVCTNNRSYTDIISLKEIFINERGDYFDPRPWDLETVLVVLDEDILIQDSALVPVYVDNLLRNRLIALYLDNTLIDKDNYQKIYNSDIFKSISKNYEATGRTVTTLDCMITVTDFGAKFILACTQEPGEIESDEISIPKKKPRPKKK